MQEYNKLWVALGGVLAQALVMWTDMTPQEAGAIVTPLVALVTAVLVWRVPNVR